MSIVTLFCLVFNVGNVNRNTTLAFFRSVINLIERGEFIKIGVLIRKNLGDSSGRCRLSVIDVTDGADVHMRLGLIVLGLCHYVLLGL